MKIALLVLAPDGPTTPVCATLVGPASTVRLIVAVTITVPVTTSSANAILVWTGLPAATVNCVRLVAMATPLQNPVR